MLLNCHTYYSLRYGTYSIEDLILEVKQKGHSAFVLSDINNTSAIIDAVRISTEHAVKPIFGIDFRNGITQQYVGIARNNQGVRELNDHLSEHSHEEKDFTTVAPTFKHAYVIYPFAHYNEQKLSEHEFIGVAISDIGQVRYKMKTLPENKLVILQPVTFANKKSFNAHRLLRAIDNNLLLSKLEKQQEASADEMMHSKEELQRAFAEFPLLLRNTERIMESCFINIEYGKFANKNLKHYSGSVAEDFELLRSESYKGLKYRFGDTPSQEVLDRIEKELEVIIQMNFASYFLINWDIVKYAQSKNYYYVGRGSGANSMIAYLLRITDVDPIDLDLYFERFINPYRSNPPDFDIDFSWTDRDDITEYIFNRFGKNKKAALVGTYNTFQFKAVVRELGKVFGLPAHEIDKLQRSESASDNDQLGQLVLKYSSWLHGFPSHISIHSSGILISEEPITNYCATFLPPKGYPTTHFSMLEAEDIGLYKFDILSQRGLGKIKDAIEIIKENCGVEMDVHNIAVIKHDAKIKDLLRSGKAMGCFYVESPAMRMLLSKLRADDYLRLVAASSIIRPGVSKSGMMHEYIVRYRDETLREKAREKLPELYDLLAETYGVMVYQEDVIKVAHSFAGLSLAEADYLRRGMSWKFKQRNEFGRVKDNFFNNCKKKGYQEQLINDIWIQIESFANYAFSKGHSASYAVESYQALYLKAYFPLEYMVATLNNGGGFYRKDIYLHEAFMGGAKIIAPCLNLSTGLCVIKEKNIYLGFGMVAELESNVIAEVVNERNRNGAFINLEEFTNRVSISLEQIRLLIRAGCFAFTNKNKRELLWEAHMLMNKGKTRKITDELFTVKAPDFKLPDLDHNEMDDWYDQMELFGFTLSLPFHLLRDPIRTITRAKDLPSLLGKQVSITGYLVTIKYASTSKGDRMYFGTFLDEEGEWIDTVHFPPSAKAYPFRGPGCYLIKGKVVVEYDFYSLDVEMIERLPYSDRESTRVKRVEPEGRGRTVMPDKHGDTTVSTKDLVRKSK